MDQDATWYGDWPRPMRHCVRWGLSSLPPKRHSPQFSAHVYCGQTAGWIKMPLGTEVGLCQVHCVRWGPSSPQRKRGTAPNFRPVSIVTKRSPVSATAELLLNLLSPHDMRRHIVYCFLSVTSVGYAFNVIDEV